MAVTLVFAGTLSAQPSGRQRHGLMSVQFADRSPLGQMSQLLLQVRPRIKDHPEIYRIEQEHFALYVPAGYRGDQPTPLLVGLGDGDEGGPPAGWQPVLDEQQVLWIGPNRAGSGRPIESRLGLALDAVMNVSRTYRVDLQHVIVVGQGSGSCPAVMLAVHFPEVVSGAILLGPPCFYRSLQIDGMAGGKLGAAFARPDALRLHRVQQEARLLFIGPANSVIEQVCRLGYEADGFRRCSFMVQEPAEGDSTLRPDDLRRVVQSLFPSRGAAASR